MWDSIYVPRFRKTQCVRGATGAKSMLEQPIGRTPQDDHVRRGRHGQYMDRGGQKNKKNPLMADGSHEMAS